MTIRKDIINLLGNEELTAKEISVNMNIKINNIRSYLSILEKSNRIEIVNDKKPYKYKTVLTNLQLLKQLYDFMSNYTNLRNDKLKEIKQNEYLIQKIKERIA